MTIYYVDSAAGSNTSPYDTWAKAATFIATIAGIDAAGDVIYVASTHNESTAGAVTLTWSGTATAPIKIICSDKTSGEPPSNIAIGGTIATTGTNSISSNNGSAVVYFYGLIFLGGSGSGSVSIITKRGIYESCTFSLVATGASGQITGDSSCFWINCDVKFSNAGQLIAAQSSGIFWSGGSLLAGGVSPTTLLSLTGKVRLENVDLSNANSAINLGPGSSTVGDDFSYRNVLLPSAWSGNLTSSTPAAGVSHRLMNCDYIGTNYVLHHKMQYGDVYSETTLIKSGGASNGSTSLSWKSISLASSGVFPIAALQTGEIVFWNEITGSSRTVTIEFLHDNATGLKDNEIWMEVNYYGASGNPQGTLVSSAMANVLATPATLASSSATWDTTGMSNPNAQKMSVTFTPQLKGFFIATVKLCKASYTVYVDPMLMVS